MKSVKGLFGQRKPVQSTQTSQQFGLFQRNGGQQMTGKKRSKKRDKRRRRKKKLQRAKERAQVGKQN